MASPGFNNPVFQSNPSAASQTYPGNARGQAFTTPTVPPQAAQPGVDAQLEGAYAAPPAGAHETGRMTVEDTIWKTVGLFAVLLVTAAVGYFWTYGGSFTGPTSEADLSRITMAPMIVGALGGLVLGLVNSFKKEPSVPLIVAYAAFEGLFIGGISAYFEMLWPGIIAQATLATISVFGVTLALFASGKIRASARATKIFMIAMIGYLVFSLLNMGLTWFGVLEGWGLRSGIFGVVIGILVVIMAAYSLVLDFDMIQNGVRNGAPRKFAWRAAFGLMVTIVWLYVEILRLIAILRGSD